jgi:hypothetical protein
MVRRVALVRTDVSEELSASIITVTRIGELGTILITLMMQVIRSSETSVLTRATQRNMPEDAILHSHRSENLKSYIYLHVFRRQITASTAVNLDFLDRRLYYFSEAAPQLSSRAAWSQFQTNYYSENLVMVVIEPETSRFGVRNSDH